MRPVLLCPKCKAIFVNRRNRACPRCGQYIARHNELWGEDDYWTDGKVTMSYEQGKKVAKKIKT